MDIMLINLNEVLQETGAHKEFKPEIEICEFEYNNTTYPIKEYNLKISFINSGKKHISSKCDGSIILVIPCDKCLDPVDYTININYFKDLDMNKTSEQRAADLDEEVYLEGKEFDFEVFIHNEILVNLPMKVLCSDDCKGICNRCGANLNKGSCKCDKAELDPRMSKILDVFNQFKEV